MKFNEALQRMSISAFYKIALILFVLKILGDGYSLIVVFKNLNFGGKISTIASFLLNFVWLGVIYYFYKNIPDLNIKEVSEKDIEMEINRLKEEIKEGVILEHEGN
jgi:hypothetical protein